jgi:chitinase
VAEGNDGAYGGGIILHLSRASAHTVTVAYRTKNGTATAGSDYYAASGTVTFSPGLTDALGPIAVIGDFVPEPDETVIVRLSSPQNATIGRGIGTLTILNDD